MRHVLFAVAAAVLTVVAGVGCSTDLGNLPGKDALINQVTSGFFEGDNLSPDCVREALERLSVADLTEIVGSLAGAATGNGTNDPPQIVAIAQSCIGSPTPADTAPASR